MLQPGTTDATCLRTLALGLLAGAAAVRRGRAQTAARLRQRQDRHHGPAATPGRAVPFAPSATPSISVADYQRALAVAMRKKYYHAKPPEAEYWRASSARWATRSSTACCCWPRRSVAASSPTPHASRPPSPATRRSTRTAPTGRPTATRCWPPWCRSSSARACSNARALVKRVPEPSRGAGCAPTTTSTRSSSSSPSRSSSA
jgi:hypothetical protein